MQACKIYLENEEYKIFPSFQGAIFQTWKIM